MLRTTIIQIRLVLVWVGLKYSFLGSQEYQNYIFCIIYPSIYLIIKGLTAGHLGQLKGTFHTLTPTLQKILRI
jgi:hypothetical protein